MVGVLILMIIIEKLITDMFILWLGITNAIIIIGSYLTVKWILDKFIMYQIQKISNTLNTMGQTQNALLELKPQLNSLNQLNTSLNDILGSDYMYFIKRGKSIIESGFYIFTVFKKPSYCVLKKFCITYLKGSGRQKEAEVIEEYLNKNHEITVSDIYNLFFKLTFTIIEDILKDEGIDDILNDSQTKMIEYLIKLNVNNNISNNEYFDNIIKNLDIAISKNDKNNIKILFPLLLNSYEQLNKETKKKKETIMTRKIINIKNLYK